ncbi:MAG: lolD [Symbiobacteriaceae bacterium]|jgi:putative ABC transport system ATP-binding protein|nr:lolD [Symbiobacteriaceae bacterium]
MATVRAAGLNKVYGEGPAAVVALDHVDLSVEKGEFVAIMGPSGSGKSTLLAILGGLETPSDGSITIDDANLSDQNETRLAEMRREKIGFIFQSFNLVPVLTAEENVAVPLLLAGRRAAEIRPRVERMLGLVGLADRRTHTPAELSGGQQQRVAIARALVTEPALVLADEPTGNLDSKTSNEILTLLRRSCDELGQTMIVITHDAGVAAWADRVLYLRDGSIAAAERQQGPLAARIHAIRTRLEEVAAHA